MPYLTYTLSQGAITSYCSTHDSPPKLLAYCSNSLPRDSSHPCSRTRWRTLAGKMCTFGSHYMAC